ncbi:hypothetical protein [Micromonospora sp. NPDC093277]|uniref:hypothetical protein n=1 Tax=Micromonospora sp. NPDC093277 TaxID=3364291 RepID=UPI0037FBB375
MGTTPGAGLHLAGHVDADPAEVATLEEVLIALDQMRVERGLSLRRGRVVAGQPIHRYRDAVRETGDLGPRAQVYATTIGRYNATSDQLICQSGVFVCS